MQLEGTVFGLLTIQLKPQLEKLLNLPNNSLTKEIKLTQDLLRLFIEYQIPSDLLSYEGDREAEMQNKLEAVKGHVKAIMDMLESTQKAQLEEAKQGFIQEKLEERERSAPVMYEMLGDSCNESLSFGCSLSADTESYAAPTAARGFGGFGAPLRSSMKKRSRAFNFSSSRKESQTLASQMVMDAPQMAMAACAAPLRPREDFGALQQQV